MTGWRAQVQCFGERDETDAEMLQFLKRRQQICYGAAPAVRRQTSTRSISRRRAASNTFSRASLRAAPEFTSRTCKAIAGIQARAKLSPPGRRTEEVHCYVYQRPWQLSNLVAFRNTLSVITECT